MRASARRGARLVPREQARHVGRDPARHVGLHFRREVVQQNAEVTASTSKTLPIVGCCSKKASNLTTMSRYAGPLMVPWVRASTV